MASRVFSTKKIAQMCVSAFTEIEARNKTHDNDMIAKLYSEDEYFKQDLVATRFFGLIKEYRFLSLGEARERYFKENYKWLCFDTVLDGDITWQERYRNSTLFDDKNVIQKMYNLVSKSNGHSEEVVVFSHEYDILLKYSSP